jgi:hypothetical protein
MKIRALGLFLSALLFATGPVFGALTDGLVLYYSFNTDTGPTVSDQSGNGHTGAVNGPAYTPAGRIGGAYHYDGTNDYILAGNLGYQGQGTISFWMYADAVENARNPFTTDYASWDDCIRFEEGGALHDFVVGLGPIAGGAYYTSNIQARTWYHVTFAWTTNKYWGWLDGKPAFTGSHNNKLYLGFPNVAVGNGFSTDPGRYWKGLVDEVRIYNRVLSGAEVTELANPSDGLLLYYSFDTNTGTTVADQSGNGHTGVVTGATYTPAGAIGGAYHFDGIDDRILGGSLGYVPTGSICFWMYADSVDNWRNPFSTDYASWDDNIHFTEAADHSFMWGALGLEPGLAVAYTQNGLQAGRWYHVALTWDGLVTRGYLDGTLANSTPYPDANSPVHPSISGTAGYWRQISLTFNNIAVGNSYSTSPERFWKGMVDEVRIYNRALSAGEVSGLAGGVSTNGLAKSLYYNFDVDEHGIVTDQSGDGNNGAVRGAQWVPNGVRGGAYQFTGTNWIEAGDIFDLAGATTQLTVSAWVKASPAVTPNEPTIVAKDQEASPYPGWLLEQTFRNTALGEIIATWPQLAAAPNSTINIAGEQWHFVCGTYETYPSFMRCRVYVDGVLSDSGTRTGVYGSTENSSPLTIGSRQPHGVPQLGYKGLIDEVRINSRILSDAEILALYNADKPAEPNPGNGLELYYSFDTNTGSTVYDQSGNGHTGLIYGPTYTANGRIGAAYQYDGINDHILAGNLGYLGQGTISFWMNADAVENWRNPFSTDYASWDDCLRFEEGGTQHDFVVGLGPIVGGAVYTSAMQPHTWYHVAFAWTGTGYWGWLNGQLAFSGSHNNQLYLNFNNVAVGNGYSTDPARYWKGMVDEVRIYNRVLSGEEVAALADTGSVATAGMLTVDIEPEDARMADAQWRLASDSVTDWRDSGFSRCLDAGNYTVVFKDLGGWVTPSSANVTVVAGTNSFLTGRYEAVTADTVPPVIVSVYPPDGYAFVGNALPMTVVVTDNVAVASVRFNHSNAVDFEPPNTYLYTRHGVRGSFNPVDIVARDTYGNETTLTLNYVQSSDLLLSAMWDGYWRVRNPFTNTIECTWNVVGSSESGSVTAVANRDNFFNTTLGRKTVRLYADGLLVDTQDSSKVNPAMGVNLPLSEIDSDEDGMNNGEEELAGTDPNDGESLFSLQTDLQSSETGGMLMRTTPPSDPSESEFFHMVFSWPSGTDSSYTLETSTDVWTWKAVTGAINMPGTGGTMSYTNTVDSPQFYLRIRAQKLE